MRLPDGTQQAFEWQIRDVSARVRCRQAFEFMGEYGVVDSCLRCRCVVTGVYRYRCGREGAIGSFLWLFGEPLGQTSNRGVLRMPRAASLSSSQLDTVFRDIENAVAYRATSRAARRGAGLYEFL